jgi:hypothetical protein
MQSNKTLPTVGPNAPNVPSPLTAFSTSLSVAPAALSLPAPVAVSAPVPAVTAIPAAALSPDFHHALSQILTPANITAFNVVVISAGATAGKKAIELFVEAARHWFTKKRSIEGFEITPPVGTTIESLKIEGEKLLITLKALGAPLASAAAVPAATLVSASSSSPSKRKN